MLRRLRSAEFAVEGREGGFGNVKDSDGVNGRTHIDCNSSSSLSSGRTTLASNSGERDRAAIGGLSKDIKTGLPCVLSIPSLICAIGGGLIDGLSIPNKRRGGVAGYDDGGDPTESKSVLAKLLLALRYPPPLSIIVNSLLCRDSLPDPRLAQVAPQKA